MSNKYSVKIRRALKKCISDPRYIDMYFFCRVFGFSQHEFQYYHFKDKFLERFSFVSFRECSQIFRKYNKTFTNKRDNYLLLSEYYKRDCCLLEADKPRCVNEKLYRSFANKHRHFIVKAFDGSAGIGIKKCDVGQGNQSVDQLFNQYPNGCLLEELIDQTPDIASVYPWSVNTLRITTVNYGNRIEAIYPVMRFGAKHEIVDNSKSGLLCAIDQSNEAIISAMDSQGESYTIHPDTGVSIIGFHIPELQSAIRLAQQLAKLFPDNVFTGFDFAHTEDGWILVEANTETRFTIWQLPYQKGFRKELRKINRQIV